MLLITILFICLALAIVVFASKKKTGTNNVQTVDDENNEIPGSDEKQGDVNLDEIAPDINEGKQELDPSICDSEPDHDDHKEEEPVPVNENYNQGKNPTFSPESEKEAPQPDENVVPKVKRRARK